MTLLSRLAARMFDLPPAAATRLECQTDLAVPMPDGVNLLANRIFPPGGERLPVVLIRSPYVARGRKPDVLSRLIAERGYQVVMQNCRGTFGSGGEFEPFRNERGDGLATLRWLAEQPWCSSGMVMFGNSYYGYVQLAAGPSAPDSLKALVPQMAASRVFGVQRGAPLLLTALITWLYQQYAEHMEPSSLRRLLARLRREGRLRRALAHLPVGEADRVAVGRTIPYFQDILRHGRPGDEFWAPTDHSELVGAIGVPVHFVAGWYDIFLSDELADYRAMRAAGKRPHLTIGPWTHVATAGIGEGMKQSLAWYDAHLRGRQEARRSSPVRVCVMGVDRWLDLPSWPPPSSAARWFLEPGGRLSPAAVPAARVTPARYRYDPADPTPNVGGTLVFGGGPKDNRKLEARPDVLTFSTPPLEREVTIMGEASAELHVRSSCPHTDFFARLCDVSRGGRSTNICDGIVRLAPGDGSAGAAGIARVVIRLHATAHCFQAGHRIRLQVSSGAHPRYNRNLGTGEPVETATTARVADQEVFHDAARPSALVLPTVDLPS